jgi:hypothetical protein
MGQQTIPKTNIKNLTKGATFSAIINCLGPVQTAYGITSPKKRTAVTDIITAQIDGTIASKKIGRASIAKAFESRSVTNK